MNSRTLVIFPDAVYVGGQETEMTMHLTYHPSANGNEEKTFHVHIWEGVQHATTRVEAAICQTLPRPREEDGVIIECRLPKRDDPAEVYLQVSVTVNGETHWTPTAKLFRYVRRPEANADPVEWSSDTDQ